MFELPPDEFYKVIPLFTGLKHSTAIVYAVLEGNSTGRVWVDDHHHPRDVLLFAEGAFYYTAGDPDNQVFCQQLEKLIFDALLPQAAEPEVVIFSASETWHLRLAEQMRHKGVITIQRKVFEFNPEQFRGHANWHAEIPVGYTMRFIDHELAAKHPAYQPLLEPKTKRFGFCLMHGEDVVCECTAVFVGKDEAEIDIHTPEPYRGRGFARLTASAFIEECLRRGLTPNWACWPEREASWKLALRLGFEELPDVPAILWAEDL